MLRAGVESLADLLQITKHVDHLVTLQVGETDILPLNLFIKSSVGDMDPRIEHLPFFLKNR